MVCYKLEKIICREHITFPTLKILLKLYCPDGFSGLQVLTPFSKKLHSTLELGQLCITLF